MVKTCFSIISLFILISGVYSQDLEKELDALLAEDAGITSATFKSTRIVNGHSIERMPEGQLDFRISHRFGQLNTGAYNLWGLDEANIHLSLEYGITNWLMVGVGRGTYEKAYDGFAKFSISRQRMGSMPVSISFLSGMAINTLRVPGPKLKIADHASYVHQLLIARKLNEFFSVEINPTFVERNLAVMEPYHDTQFAIGAGARMKITKRVSVNLEYYHSLMEADDYLGQKTYNPLSVGCDIETGGHVFQLFLSNSIAMIEKGFISETTGNWGDGGVHFGFNISRVFALK